MNKHQSTTSPAQANHSVKTTKHQATVNPLPKKPVEVGGPKGPEPTRYGDWETAGRCTDF